MAKLVKVQIGPTNYLKMTEEDAKAYIKEHGAYGAAEADEEPQEKPEPEAKAKDEPTETKMKAKPAENKSRSRKSP